MKKYENTTLNSYKRCKLILNYNLSYVCIAQYSG